ncbi:MAG: dTDP-glucose 4,6-dehydratase [Candidatus Saganbacteria bacterium]|nr:dTDP-glucose 4,6-dehydratase [Candidatus Saganbacteria bacterium]
MKKKTLITGGAGFIGSNFVRLMVNRYPDEFFVNLDKLTYAGNLENLKEIEGKPNYRFVKGDIGDQDLVTELTKECSVVVNFAAETHVDRSILGAKEFILTNIVGTYTLLEAARHNHCERFVHVSTDEVYGSIEKGFFSESSNLHPNSPYAASKASSDLLALSYYTTYGFPVIVTRASNNYGPYQYPEKVIPLFITNLLQGEKVPLYGDGLNVRDWLYVLDHCSGIDVVLRKGKIGEVYNIGGENEVTNIELTRMIFKLMDKDESHIQPVADRLGHDRRYALKCDKVKTLGWKQTANFDQLLAETVQWYKKNKPWWEAIIKKQYKERL